MDNVTICLFVYLFVWNVTRWVLDGLSFASSVHFGPTLKQILGTPSPQVRIFDLHFDPRRCYNIVKVSRKYLWSPEGFKVGAKTEQSQSNVFHPRTHWMILCILWTMLSQCVWLSVALSCCVKNGLIYRQIISLPHSSHSISFIWNKLHSEILMEPPLDHCWTNQRYNTISIV